MAEKHANIEELVYDDHNFNQHTAEGMELLEKSIRENKFGRSILIDKDNRIIAGNGIVEAATKTGTKKIRVIETDGDELIAVKRKDLSLDSQEGRRLALADNATSAANLKWDEKEIAHAQEEWGIMPEEWNVQIEQPRDENTPPQQIKEDDFARTNIKKRCATGDIWLLGDHRLMCGDSTNATTVQELMNGERAALCFTDPPYGMKKEKEGIVGDNLNYDDLFKFNEKWIPLSFECLSDVGSWYCWGIDEPLMDIYSGIIKPMTKQRGDRKVTFRNLIVWDKGAAGFGICSAAQRCYFPHDEKCLFVMRGRQDYGQTKDVYWAGFEPLRQKLNKWCDLVGKKKVIELTNTASTHWYSQSQWAMIPEGHLNTLRDYCIANGIDAFNEEIRAEYDQIRAEWYKTRAYFDNTHDSMTAVWRFPVTSQKEREETGGHATPKPIALCGRAIKSSSRERDIVLDLFGGSGSTLIACEQLNRKCYTMELMPEYCDIIIARWEKFTGKKAEKINK